MPPTALLLFSRRGCCLCEGLEQRLRELPIPPALQVLDIDADPTLLARYDLSVPVLARPGADGGWQELPRVPPRLEGARLAEWLQRHGGAAAPGADDPAAGSSRHSGGGSTGHSI